MKWFEQDSSLTLILEMFSMNRAGPIAAPRRQPVMANFLLKV